MIKMLSKVGIEAAYLNIIKTIHEKLTTSIIYNRQKLQTFPLRSGTRQSCLFAWGEKARLLFLEEGAGERNEKKTAQGEA